MDHDEDEVQNQNGYAWEAEYKRSWDVLKEDETGLLRPIRPKRREEKLIKRGMIRQFVLVIDCSKSMTEQDLRPNRLDATLTLVKSFIREFFDQNPLSLMLILAMRDGLCERWSTWLGNPNDLSKVVDQRYEPSGDCSLKNALEMCRQALVHVPSHVSREVLIIYGALYTSDPGDIYKSIKDLSKDSIRVSIVGLSAQLKICQTIVNETKGTYDVITNESHYKEILHQHVLPPPLHSNSTWIHMGFPTVKIFDFTTLCACHHAPVTNGHICPRCRATVCEIPRECPICTLTLVSAPALARSYHHLFPVAATPLNVDDVGLVFHMLKQVLLNALVVIAQSSIPEIGSSSRYRAAPRNSMLAIVPVDGAEFIPNQRFDVSIELHDLEQAEPDISLLQFTINGQSADLVLGKKYEVQESWNFTYAKTLKALDSKDMTRVFVSRIAIRSGKLKKSGKYNIRVSMGGHTLTAEWVVRATQPRSAKNLILMIGDGMASSMITAARTISKTTRFGKFQDNVLNLEKLGGSIGKIMTNGIDSIMTDSANSAAAYNTGQKGWSSGLNVYSDTSESTLDDPKVESIAEYIRSYRSNMCIGIVTTAEVQDATPAAVFAHTRNRDDKDVVTDQALNGFSHNNLTWDPKPVKSDVLFGGGGAYYCTKAPNCKSLNQRNFYDEFRKSGYAVVNSKDELMSYDGKDPILGIFNGRVMDTWIDRNLYPESLSSKGDPFGANQKAPSQPSLEQMTMKAIEVLNGRCNDGFFLMVEAASIDKAMHNIDYDRGLAELLELDRTVKEVNDWRLENQHLFETAVIVTSDHAQSFDVSGVVDTEYLAELPEQDTIAGVTLTGKNADLQYFKRRALGIYEYAGFPDLVTDSNGMPTNWEGRYRLWSGKLDAMQHKEDFKIKKKYRESTIEDKKLSAAFGSSVYVMNPEESGMYYAPVGNPYYEKTGHSLQAVDLYCAGPQAFTTQCAKVMDNTELFFIMANTLGLGNDFEMNKTKEEKQEAATTVYVEKTLTVYLASPTAHPYKRDLSGDTTLRAQFFSLILLVTIFSI